ncbi:MAG: hypothetical protein KF832_13940 [Caldilineaceae bacterium]|nr:hypothetical protein [Caldilineaceae bacterium]
MIRTVTATRYIHPLREGGSVPAVVEADDGELYVMKFVGAAQGAKALIAELVAGEIARTLGLRLPEIVLIELDPVLGRSEPHPEIRDLIQASGGLNLALRYLPSAFAYNPLLQPPLAAELASAIVWFDAYVTNVDRTPRNVNMLLWQDELWLIDHGAALYFHYDWTDYLERSRSPFAFIRQHVLIKLASKLRTVDEQFRPLLTPARLQEIVSWIPTVWLGDEKQFADAAAHRAAYADYLSARVAAADTFVGEAVNAHAALV